MDDLTSRLLKALKQEAGSQTQANTDHRTKFVGEVRHQEGIPIRRLRLRRETETLLSLKGIRTVERLRSMSRVELLKVPHMTLGSFSEIQRAVRASTTETGGLSLTLLDLPGWVERPLVRAGINSVEQLCEFTPSRLMQLPGIGPRALAEVSCTLRSVGRSLREEALETYGQRSAAPSVEDCHTTGTTRIGLIGCSRSQLSQPAPARELFSPSAVFRESVAYLERRADRVYVLSSEYGLLTLDQEIDPYDTELDRLPTSRRRAWAKEVVQALMHLHGPSLKGLAFEFHAPFRYHEFLEPLLVKAGAVCECPVKGMSQGQRHAFYRKALSLGQAHGVSQPEPSLEAAKTNHPLPTPGLKIHVEIWLAAALLHEAGHPTFSPGRLAEEVEHRFGDTRPGVVTHITAHCCASSPKNSAAVHNYLVRTDRGEYRLWRHGDPIHSSRP